MSANGRLTSSELTTVDGVLLERRTARAYRAMQSEAGAVGITLVIVQPAGGYRPYSMQAGMRADFFAKRIPGQYNLSPVSTVPPAVAGYSAHGWGTCVDIADFTGSRMSWVLANAHRFGFSRTFGSNDPNHFQYDGVTVPPGTSVAGVGSVKPVHLPAAPFVLAPGHSFNSTNGPKVVGNYRLRVNGEKNIIWEGLVGSSWVAYFSFHTGVSPANPDGFYTEIVNQLDKHFVAYAKKNGSKTRTARWAGPKNWRRIPAGCSVHFQSDGTIALYDAKGNLAAVIRQG